MKLKIFLPAILTAAIAISALPWYLYIKYSSYRPISYEAESFRESAKHLDSPFTGFYQIHGYILSDDADFDISRDAVSKEPNRLVMIQVNLSNYRGSQISGAALSSLDHILSSWAEGGRQIILRFLYDWDGVEAAQSEPDDINTILTHMRQTAKVYNKYAKSIFTLQGLYTGSYGEMHDTRYGSGKDMSTLAKTLYEESDPSIFLAVRTPAQLRSISKELDGLVDDRLGLFNDGMMASDTDAGTYAEGKREDELKFQNKLCSMVPNGGEAISDNPLNDFENAVKYMETSHVSYINSLYDSNVLNKWKNTTVSFDGPYKGGSGYDYIKTHLGFRYVLRSSSLNQKNPFTKKARLAVKIENVGFAPAYYGLDYKLTLLNVRTGKSYVVPVEVKSAGTGRDDVGLFSEIDIDALAHGKYGAYIKASDKKTGEAIKYANDVNPSERGYLVGTVAVRKKDLKSFLKDLL